MKFLKFLLIFIIILEISIPEFRGVSSNFVFFAAIWIIFLAYSYLYLFEFYSSFLLFSLLLITLISFPGINIFSFPEFTTYLSYISLSILSYNLMTKKQFIRIMQLLGLVICIYTLFQIFFIFPYLRKILSSPELIHMYHLKYILNKNRAFAVFLTSNCFAGFLIFLLPLTLYALPQITKIPYVFTIIFLLYSTKSMGAIIALAVTLLIALFLNTKLKKLSFLILSVILISLILIIFQRKELLLNPHNLYFNPFFQRLQIWVRTLKLIIHFPIKGIGLGNFPVYYNKDLPQTVNQTLYVHNIFLQFWVELGILGFIWMVSFYINCWRKIKIFLSCGKQENVYLALGCLTFLLHNIIDFTFFLPQMGIIFWISLAVLLRKE